MQSSQLAAGIDPNAAKKAQKDAQLDTYEALCREWLEQKRGRTILEAQYARTLSRHEKDVFPWLGSRPIREITAPEVLRVLRCADERGARYTAHKIRSEISQCMRYAIATGRAERDPCPDLRGAIPSVRTRHMASITNPPEVAELLRAIDGFRGTFVVRRALCTCTAAVCAPGRA